MSDSAPCPRHRTSCCNVFTKTPERISMTTVAFSVRANLCASAKCRLYDQKVANVSLHKHHLHEHPTCLPSAPDARVSIRPHFSNVNIQSFINFYSRVVEKSRTTAHSTGAAAATVMLAPVWLRIARQRALFRP